MLFLLVCPTGARGAYQQRLVVSLVVLHRISKVERAGARRKAGGNPMAWEVARGYIIPDNAQGAHDCDLVAGRLRVAIDDGTEAGVGPGDLAVIAPGHNAWSSGNETCVF